MKKILSLIILLILLSQSKGYGQSNGVISNDSLKVFCKYLQKHIRYPAIDRENEVTGRIFISFKIVSDVTGSHVVDIKKLRDSTTSCGDEVVRVLQNYTGLALKTGSYSFSVDFVIGNGDAKISNRSGALLEKDKPRNFLADIIVVGYQTVRKREPSVDYEIIKPVVH